MIEFKFRDYTCFHLTVFEGFVTIDKVRNNHSEGILVLTPKGGREFEDMPFLQGLMGDAVITDLISLLSSPEDERRIQLEAANLFVNVISKLKQLEAKSTTVQSKSSHGANRHALNPPFETESIWHKWWF